MGCGSGGTDLGPTENQQGVQRRSENIAVNQIRNAFSGFTPNFYQGIANAYQNYANPQLQQQYRNATNQYGFQLANQGLQKSSQAQQGYGTLSDANNAGKTQIAQTGQGLVQNMQNQVANQEANLIGMAQSAAQPGQLVTQAQGVAANTSAPSSFAPIGQAFTQALGTLSGVGNQYLGNQLQQALIPFMNPYGSSGGGGWLPSNS